MTREVACCCTCIRGAVSAKVRDGGVVEKKRDETHETRGPARVKANVEETSMWGGDD